MDFHQGASAAQARAAMKRCKDVMEAAEKIFSGEFDNAEEDRDVEMVEASSSRARLKSTQKMAVG